MLGVNKETAQLFPGAKLNVMTAEKRDDGRKEYNQANSYQVFADLME